MRSNDFHLPIAYFRRIGTGHRCSSALARLFLPILFASIWNTRRVQEAYVTCPTPAPLNNKGVESRESCRIFQIASVEKMMKFKNLVGGTARLEGSIPVFYFFLRDVIFVPIHHYLLQTSIQSSIQLTETLWELPIYRDRLCINGNERSCVFFSIF